MLKLSDTDSYQVISQYLKDEFDFEGEDISEMFEEYMENIKIFFDNCSKNLASSNFEQLAKDGHMVKGSSINISAKLMAILAMKLELATKDNNAEACNENIEKMKHNFNALQKTYSN